MSMSLKHLFFALGCALMLLNLFGLTRSLRSAELAAAGLQAGDLTLSHSALKKEAVRRPGERSSTYIARATEAVNRGMAHYWPDHDVGTYNIRVPIWENYLLHAASYLRPDVYRKYEFADPDKAMERGVGLCSQHSIVLTRLLQRAGIDATMQALSGHVVVRVQDESGSPYIADPDYGVVFPHDIETLERSPQMISAAYRLRGIDPDTVDQLVGFYGPDGNYPLTVPEYFYHKVYYVEVIAYVIKWVLPLTLMAPLLLSWRRRREAKAGV